MDYLVNLLTCWPCQKWISYTKTYQLALPSFAQWLEPKAFTL